jgi:DedD protein
MRLPFLKPKPEAAAKPERARRATAPADDPASVQAARTQARRRLVGALVLLVIGVVGFPVLFETQPRPLPMDTPIEARSRDGAGGALAAGGATESRPTKPLPVTSLPADAGSESAAPPAEPAPASGPAAGASMPVPRPPLPVPAPAPAPAPASASASASASAAASAAAPTALAPAASAARFVVQAGAYSDPAKLREARAKIEHLGLKTYTQVIETEGSSRTRVRVGPYATRAEAEAVAARIKRAGLVAATLAL